MQIGEAPDMRNDSVVTMYACFSDTLCCATTLNFVTEAQVQDHGDYHQRHEGQNHQPIHETVYLWSRQWNLPQLLMIFVSKLALMIILKQVTKFWILQLCRSMLPLSGEYFFPPTSGAL